MTDTTETRTRFARMYAAGILTLVAATVASAAWTQASTGQSAIDVSTIMISVDTGSLPVQAHIDAI
jgi:hypothetical protein